MKSEWNGDVDLGDGQLSLLRQKYEGRLSFLNSCLHHVTEVDFCNIIKQLEEDREFAKGGLLQAIPAYQKKMQNGTQQSILESCWDVAEYNLLKQQADHFLTVYKKAWQNGAADLQAVLLSTADKFREYSRGLFKRRRTAASHILVILASEEARQTKPYCVPLQFIPCTVMKDMDVQRHLTEAVQVLHKAGVTVVGTVTDGEYSTLR